MQPFCQRYELWKALNWSLFGVGEESIWQASFLGLCTCRICQFLLFNSPDLLTSGTYGKAYFFLLVLCGSGCWLGLDNDEEGIRCWDGSGFAFAFVLFAGLFYLTWGNLFLVFNFKSLPVTEITEQHSIVWARKWINNSFVTQIPHQSIAAANWYTLYCFYL